jgi:major type 1 subunit fimbrin (pilin)
VKKLLLVFLPAVFAMAPPAAFASDGTITFTGSVTSQTCVINGGAPDFTVALPKVSSTVLNSADAKAGQTNFRITLTSCDPAKNSARAFFEIGPNVNADSGRLKTNVSNVEIGLANADGKDIKIGESSRTDYLPISADRTATLNYIAQYVATGAAGIGDVKTSVTYSVEYQ